MPWRTSHGNARKGGRAIVLETLPSDELPPASPGNTVPAQRDASGRFLAGNVIARQAKARAGRGGALAALEAKGDPIWQAANKWGRRWTSHRMTELGRLFGDLSAEVCAMVVDAGDGRADARYLRAKAAAETYGAANGVAAQSESLALALAKARRHSGWTDGSPEGDRAEECEQHAARVRAAFAAKVDDEAGRILATEEAKRLEKARATARASLQKEV